jgi:hypothetical protein
LIARAVIGVAAAAVIFYAAGLVLGGGSFPAPGEPGANPDHVILLVAVTLGVTFLHVVACLVAQRSPPRLFYVLLVGVAARLILLFGAPAPVLEGDHARIRFEGRLVNLGLNPYEFRPVHLMDEDPQGIALSASELARVQQARAALTASTDAPRPEQILRPDLRTDSTPLSLLISALADRFKPASTRGYAYFVLCADVLAGFLLLLALRARRLPAGWLLIYAWCPVLLKEAYTTLALDAFLMPALAGLIYCLAAGRRIWAALPLGLALALEPAFLFVAPVVGRKIGLPAVLLALVLAALPVLPFVQMGDVPVESYLEGQIHVWRYHEYNSVLENLFRGALGHLPQQAENTLIIAGVQIVGPGQPLSGLLAKVCCLVVLLGVVTYLVIRFRPERDDEEVGFQPGPGDLFVCLLALLATAPVLQPQHALWLLPLLVVRFFGTAWIALPGLVSLCYLTHLDGPQQADLVILGGMFSFRVLEYGAVLLLLALDLLWQPFLGLGADEDGAFYRATVGDEETLAFELGGEAEAAPVGAGRRVELHG